MRRRTAPSPAAIMGCTPLVLLVLYAAFEIGSQRHAQFERQAAAELASESQLVCEHLRIPLGSESYVDCLAELDRVRQRHKARLEAEAGPAI